MEKFKLDNFKTLYHRNMPIVKTFHYTIVKS